MLMCNQIQNNYNETIIDNLTVKYIIVMVSQYKTLEGSEDCNVIDLIDVINVINVSNVSSTSSR